MPGDKPVGTATSGGVQPTESLKVAQWQLGGDRLLARRFYWNASRQPIDRTLTGSVLPAKAHVEQLAESSTQQLLGSAQVTTDLPMPFYAVLLDELAKHKGEHPFPVIMQNKHVTVSSCIKKMSADSAQILSEDNWEKLGWDSKLAYQKWLNTKVLFAFSGSGHYCSAPRVFDFVGSNESGDHFQQVAPSSAKITNIFSVAGFEYRRPEKERGSLQADIDQTLQVDATGISDVQKYSIVTMQQILAAAANTNTTDIVMIPVGMGVFLQQYRKEDIKNEMLEGWIKALNDYKGPPINLHGCLMPGQFEKIVSKVNNLNISFQDRAGQDAYTVANAIQDQPGRKSMLVNAGDHDWIAALDPGKGPGQFANGHTLYMSTSDEYFALTTLFSAFSIANIKRICGDLGNKIISTFKSAPAPVAADVSPHVEDVQADISHSAEEAMPLVESSQKTPVQDFVEWLQTDEPKTQAQIKMFAQTQNITKEAVLAYIRSQDPTERVKLVKESFKVGTGLNEFFSIQRGILSTAEHRGSFKQLAEMLPVAGETLKKLSWFSRNSEKYRQAVESTPVEDKPRQLGKS